MGCFSSKLAACDITPQSSFFDEYELGDILGRGAYGIVHVTYDVESREKFAVKILSLSDDRNQSLGPRAHQLREDVVAEQRALARIGSHPNVVGFREYFIDDGFAYFVIELCSGSMLTAWMAEPDLNEYTYALYFIDMTHHTARALAHIHSVGVVHRDVKQANFMVGAPDGRTVKLFDFGLSAVMEGGNMLSGQVGTAPYMALEVANYPTTHGPPADVWSFGVVVYIAFFGCWPYPPRRRMAEELFRVQPDTSTPMLTPTPGYLHNSVSDVGIDFVEALLDRDPLTRPSAASCLEMAYLARRCPQPQAEDIQERSLVPQLHAARNGGVFNLETPKADAGQELNLMQRQRAARLRREQFDDGCVGVVRERIRLLWQRMRLPKQPW